MVRNGMTGATGNIYCGLHEFADMAFLLHLLRPNDLFIDVGSNIGSYTVLASAVCRARSISFEPDPNTMRSLSRNVHANKIGDLVTLHEAAVGAQNGTVDFTSGHDTTNRVITGSSSTGRQVAVRRLDDILVGESPVLLKIDVEGYESEVIAGAMQTLKEPTLAAIIIETVDKHIEDTLKVAHFQRAFYDPMSRRLSLAPNAEASQNHMFVRPDLVIDRIASAARRSIIGISV